MHENRQENRESVFDPLDAETAAEMYSGMVYKLAYSRLGSREDAEDVMQEVFLRYVRSRPGLESEEHRKAWLIRVTLNCSVNFATSAWKRHHAALTDELAAVTPEPKSVVPETGPALELLQMLPAKYRQVLHLFYYEELSVGEISALLDTKEGTVKSLLYRGRARLKKLWEKWEVNHDPKNQK